MLTHLTADPPRESDPVTVKRICQNCKNWDISRKGDFKECAHPSVGVQVYDGIYEEGMTYYHEGIRTGPNFGCIHFDPK